MTTTRHLCAILVLLAVAMTGGAPAASAATVLWDGSTDMTWSEPDTTSWSGETYNSGDTAQFQGAGQGTVTVSGTVTPASVVVTSGNYTFSGGSIGGSSSLVKEGAGILHLGTANTYSGGTILRSGDIEVNHNASLGSGLLTIEGGTITPRNASRTLTNNILLQGNFGRGSGGGNNVLTLSGTVDLDGGIRTITAPATGANPPLILSGVISNGGLVKEGNGVMRLSGPNTYSDGTTVNNGRLELSWSNTSNNLGTIRGVLTINAGATVRSTVDKGFGFASSSSGNVTTIHINGGLMEHAGTNGHGGGQTIYMTGGEIRSNNGTSSTTSNYFRFTTSGSNRTIYVLPSSSTALISGRVHLDALGRFDVADGSADDDLLISAAITGGNGIQKDGAGRMTLTGANTYTGATTVTAGTLRLGGNGTLGANSGALTVSGGTLDLGGKSVTKGAVTISGGTIENGTLTGSSFAGQSGTVSASLAGSGGLTKTTTDILTLSGNNTYSGGTTIGTSEADRGGVVVVASSTALGTGMVTNQRGGELQLSGGVNVANILVLSNDGPGGARGIRNIDGDNTWSGEIRLTTGRGGSIIQVDDGSLTLAGNITAISSDRWLRLQGPGNGTVSGVISNGSTTDLPVEVAGTGTWTFTGNNTYTGATTINSGTLLVNGSLGNTAVAVNSGGTLGGFGSIAGNVTVNGGGILSPGQSVGTLGLGGDLTFSQGAFFDIDIDAVNLADLVQMAGGLLTLSDEATIRVNLGFRPELGDSWTIIQGESDIAGLFNDQVTILSGSHYLDGWKWLEVGYGNSVYLTVVPEPGTWLLLLAAAACGLLVRRRN